MSEKERYITEILGRLLKKYYKRELQYGQAKIARRIQLNIREVYPGYEKLDADMEVKEAVNQAARTLKELEYIGVSCLPYSDDIEKIYLNAGKIGEIEAWLEGEFGIPARPAALDSMNRLLEEYAHRGELTAYYCGKLRYDMEHSALVWDAEKARELLKMLAFLQDNERDLYVREASVLVYGDSKHFEQERYEAVCGIIREALGKPAAETEAQDEILQIYHISSVEQEISVKGDFLIEMEGYSLETGYFSGGLSLSTRDIRKIRRITVRTPNLVTVENKTSFYRFAREGFSEIYLGGYANRHQAELLKKIYGDNPDCIYWHFGDIDVGGFQIHQHLCEATGIGFRLFCMGTRELCSERFRAALLELTENDAARAKKLAEKPVYREILQEMLTRGVKMEQEIVSLFLMEGACATPGVEPEDGRKIPLSDLPGKQHDIGPGMGTKETC